MVVIAAIVVGAMILAGVRRLARCPGVLSDGPADLTGAARIARADRWTAGVILVWVAAALLVTFVLGGRAAIFGLIYVGALVASGYALVTRTATGSRLLHAIPQSWLIGIQTYRVVGAAFLIAGAYGVVPAYFALPAGYGDLITGIGALIVAISWARGLPSARSAAWAWNHFGLLDLVVAVGIALSLFAAPAAALFGGSPAWLERAALGFQPLAPPIFPVGSAITLIATLLAPLAILLHLLSVTKLVRERAGAERALEPRQRFRETSAAALRS
jgi:hypothetical protein